MRTSLYAGIALVLFVGSASAGTFTDVGVAGGQLTGLSHNGRIASGIAGGSAWRWNKDRGAVVVSGFGDTNGMSSWAQPLAGTADDGNGKLVAALAYSNSDLVGGPILIGAWPGGVGLDSNLSAAYDASDNGIAVGQAYDETSNPIAFRWTTAEGMTRLTVNRPENYSRANAISADGSTIVGWNDQEDGSRTGVIWQDGVPLDLVDANGDPVGEALAVNSDGSVVVGQGYNNPDTGNSEAWRWTAATGVQSIGCFDDGINCGPAYSFAVSDDGNTIVGASGFGIERSATIWTPDTGLQLLSDYVTAQGVTIPDGWDMRSGSGVSADGKTLAGWGFGPSSLGSFVIDLHGDPQEAILEAHGTVNWNDLPSGPFAGIPVGTPVTMTFRMSPDGFEIEPGEDTRYPVLLDTFQLQADTASDALVATEFGPSVHIANDYPLSDGIHLMTAPMVTDGQTMEFELFNPGGDMFDSDDLNRINRTFGPEFFEKISWLVSQDGGSFGMYMDLQSVSIHDYTAGPTTYTIGGSVSGLSGSGLVLQQSGADDLAIGADGPFTFPTAVTDGSIYTVSVLTQPTNPAQTCTVDNGSGTVSGADVTDVAVTCVTDVSDVIFADGFDAP